MRLFTDLRGSARTPACVRHVLPLLTTAVLAFAQPADTPKFEVADVHASPPTLRPQPAGPFYGDGRYELQTVNMLDLIHTAYGVDPERVYGGPNWLEMERFDVIAKTPNGSNAESRKLMLQALLADLAGGPGPGDVPLPRAGLLRYPEAAPGSGAQGL